MKKYAKEFFKRGFAFGGLGPIIAGIIWLVIEKSGVDFSLTGAEAFLGVISTYLLAFIQAGASVFNQIEEWPVPKSTFFHFLSIYVAYSLCYIVNSWIPFEPIVLAIFTGIFAVSYAVIWITVYLIVKSTSKKMNRKLAG